MKVKQIMRKTFLSIDESNSISELLGLLKKKKLGYAFVFRKNKFLGVTDKRSIIKSKVDVNKEKVSNCIKNVPKLRDDFDITDAAALMFHAKVPILPVEKDQKIIGCVKASDIIANANEYKELTRLKGQDIRYSKVVNVKEKSRVGKVIEIMFENGFSQLPIVDKYGNLSSIITTVDLMDMYLLSAHTREVSSKINTVGIDQPDILSMPAISFAKPHTEIITAKLSDNIKTIAKKMTDNRVSNVIIKDVNSPRYIISKRDLLEAFMKVESEVNFNIFFKGFNKLKENYLKYYAQKLCSFYAKKIDYLLNNSNKIIVNLKEYGTAGKADKQHKFSIHILVDYPGRIITSTKASDWDLSRTIHKAFNDIETQVKKISKKDENHLKKRKPSLNKQIHHLSQKFIKD